MIYHIQIYILIYKIIISKIKFYKLNLIIFINILVLYIFIVIILLILSCIINKQNIYTFKHCIKLYILL